MSAEKIIFKQRHRVSGTGRQFSSGANAQHLQYIGTREGVLTENSDNGLFGQIGGEFLDNVELTQASSYIAKMTAPNRDIFRCVYSFTSESAEEAYLRTRKDWQDWAKLRTYEIAEAMNIPMRCFEYYAAVHLKKGQPHIHFMYWNTEQKIAINTVDPLKCDDIRIAAIKSTYKEYFTELHNEEDRLIAKLRQGFVDELRCNNTMLLRSEPKRCTDAAQSSSDCDTVSQVWHALWLRQNAANGNNLWLSHLLADIFANLPKNGRLAYGYMPIVVKQQLDELTDYIIQNSSELYSIYCEIMDNRRIYNEALHSSDTSYGRLKAASFQNRLDDDIKRSMGNAILKVLAGELKSEYEQQPNQPVDQLLLETLSILRNTLNDSESKLSAIGRRILGKGDLSKEALRDLIYEQQDRENTSGI